MNVETGLPIRWEFSRSKPFTGKLSPGCRICGEGDWSCLFINNICNGSCFFCPAEQNTVDEPATNLLRFPTPGDYIDYIRTFGFRG